MSGQVDVFRAMLTHQGWPARRVVCPAGEVWRNLETRQPVWHDAIDDVAQIRAPIGYRLRDAIEPLVKVLLEKGERHFGICPHLLKWPNQQVQQCLPDADGYTA